MTSSAVARLLEQTARAVYDERGPAAVHAGQWAVLRYLADAGRAGRTVGGVADHLGVTHAPASRAVSALQRKKLVTVKPATEDRRVRQIDLTTAGRALLARDPMRRLAEAIEELGEKRMAELAEMLDLLHARLARA